jgi:hypothetical protein
LDRVPAAGGLDPIDLKLLNIPIDLQKIIAHNFDAKP